MMLATALAADRVVIAAAPVFRPQIVQTARRISDRRSRSFRQVVPAQRIEAARSVRFVAVVADVVVDHQAIVHPTTPDPFQFRLPPPAR